MLADIGANPACKQNPNGAGTALTFHPNQNNIRLRQDDRAWFYIATPIWAIVNFIENL